MKSQQMQKNHLTAMKRQLLSPSKEKGTGRVLKGSPFRRLPAVSKYKLLDPKDNLILRGLDISLKLPRKAITKPTKTKSANRYMAHVLTKIRNWVKEGKYKKAWKIAELNIKSSKCFRASAYNFVFSGWYYKQNVNEVWKINRKVEKILSKELSNLSYKRVYIEKLNGKLRPLGVPTPEWRVALHLINGFFVEILQNEVGLNQHAYLPGRGTMSAWKEVIKKIDSKFVYETDLKGFFDNISVWKILNLLRTKECNYSNWLKELCKAIPKFPEEKKLDESKFDVANINDSEIIMWENLGSEKGKLIDYTSGKPKYISTPEVDELGFLNYGILPGGFPQGMNLSPFLSILGLKEYLKAADHVNYADDQLFFGEKVFKVRETPKDGIKHASEKCKWIKQKGIWKEDSLKFLGFRLWKNGCWKSETRSGVKGEINPMIAKIYTVEGVQKLKSIKSITEIKNFVNWLGQPTKPSNNWEVLRALRNKNIMGFVMSCMILNDWKNNHSGEDRRKAVSNHLRSLNQNSWLGRIPSNLDSSRSIPFLLEIMSKVVKKGSNKMTAGKKSLYDNMKWNNFRLKQKYTRSQICNIPSKREELSYRMIEMYTIDERPKGEKS